MTSIYFPRQIEIGRDSLSKLGEIAQQMEVTNLFVIIDAFLISQLSYDKKIKEIVGSKNINVTFFSEYQGEPTTNHVNDALLKLNQEQSDCVVAIGGGSAIDIGKATSLFGATPTVKWEEIAGTLKLNRLPLIAIPTTAGTGSEATKVMVITNVETHQKMNPGHKDLIPDIAILDPVLTESLPPHFTAYTGMDALSHAIEAYISTKATPITDNFALSAIKMIGKSLPRAYIQGEDLDAREEMLLASLYAGIAFSNASTNLAHAIGRALGARFNIPHGLSVSLILPFVLDYGMDVTIDRYVDIGSALGVEKDQDAKNTAVSTVKCIDRMNDHFGIWQAGVKYINVEDLKDNMNILVEDALSGNGILTNKVVPSHKDIEEILHMLMQKLKKAGNNELITS